MQYEKIFGTPTKPYTLNAIRLSLYLVCCALHEFATLRIKSGKVVVKWAVMVFKMRHLTRASAMSEKANLNYRLNAAVNESDVSTAEAVSLVIATFNVVTRERLAENNK